MNDLYLNPDTGDVYIGNFQAEIVKGAARVRQNLELKLKLWVGEWFLDTEFGTPYLESILGKRISLNAAVSELKRVIMSVQDVDQLTSFKYNFNRSNRRLTVDFECHTPFGLIRVTTA